MAQFYNGYQQDFGKNRVQYDEKFWFYFRYDNYDIYFDKNGRNISEYVANNVDTIYKEIKKTLEYDYSRRIVFVVYNTMSDFRQSNIGYSTSDDEYNVGGTTQIIDNKVVLYFSGDHNDLLRQIRKGIAEVMVSEYLFGIGNYRKILSNSALEEYPSWFFDGFIEYISKSWTIENEEYLCQKLEQGKSLKLSQLYAEDATLLGCALWTFIVNKYGADVVSNILYLSKISEDLNATFQYVTNLSIQDLLQEMSIYYLTQKSTAKKVEIEQNVTIPKRLTKQKITDIALNSDASKMAFVTNKNGKVGIWLYDFNTQETYKIFKMGSVIEQITDYSYPVIQWNPSGKAVSFFYEDKSKLFFAIYNIDDEDLLVREFHHFEKVLDFSYSEDGSTIVFSGVKAGQTDIYTYNLQTFDNQSVTYDIADDRFPVFVQHNDKILFTSNRDSEKLQYKNCSISSNYDLFIVSGDSLQRIVSSSVDNERKPLKIDEGKYFYLTNNSGVSNISAVFMDSTVSSVDTAFHFSYFFDDFYITDNSVNTRNYSLENNFILQLFEVNGRQKLYLHELTDNDYHFIGTSVQNTEIEESQRKKMQINDTVSVALDTSLRAMGQRATANLYKTNFYINELVNQLDFNFVNTGYQNFTGGEYDYSRNMNVLLKLGIIDLFEDYRLTGAYRFTGSFGSNEYLVSVENLRNRIDRQYIFHRQSMLTYGTTTSSYYERVQDNNLILKLKYPLNQVQSFSVIPNIRYVRNVVLATNLTTLEEPIANEFWAGVSCNYVFDNVRKCDVNIYNGTRAKVFAEGYLQANESSSYLGVLGFDVRHYQKIHRNFIVAARMAYSSSFGTSPLLYYLGAVDNWINLFSKYDTYNSSIEYDHSVNWAYQAIGTNMRGFSQNIRNGNSFAVINLELRWPIIQYFFQKPIKSDILKNFQIVGFLDYGGAWNGFLPGGKENAYNYTIIDEASMYIEIDEMRQPFVFGYGYGLRTRLFGYFIRLDFAWGNDDGYTQPISYFSIGMDF